MEHHVMTTVLLLGMFTSLTTAMMPCLSETYGRSYCPNGYNCCNDADGTCCPNGKYCIRAVCIHRTVMYLPIVFSTIGVVLIFICCLRKRRTRHTVEQSQRDKVIQQPEETMQQCGQSDQCDGQQSISYEQSDQYSGDKLSLLTMEM